MTTDLRCSHLESPAGRRDGEPEIGSRLVATDRLPDLSAANVRAMLRAAMPLPDLAADRAALVVEHLVNRTRSRQRRRQRQPYTGHDP